MWASGVSPHAATHASGGGDPVPAVAGYTDITAGVAFGTTYQNTLSVTCWIVCFGRNNGGNYTQTIHVDTTTPASTIVSYNAGTSTLYTQCIAPVPPGCYWKIVSNHSAGNITVLKWV